jgi:hypothetical protein
MDSKQGGMEYFPDLEGFFAPLAAVLQSFGERHNLKLEKYYHEEPSWSFTFRHPSGGVGKISVIRSRDEVDFDCAWWYDDYDTMTRHIKRMRKEHAPAQAEVMGQELERTLPVVLSWQPGSWDEVHGGNKVWQKTWTRDEFLRLSEKYPIPKP